ncbi:MAG: ATP-dependent helicase HrpB, partial [Boseongicola sp. SB0670_bin_30]|nr:ATP-dependent helicase HrpB [Boseongicola sp. SB0670_bin_30]
IRVVIDSGYTRRARFDPGSGMSRLVTERVTRAEAEQRRGRAGRVADGVCYRLWTKGEEGALAQFAPPEIETGDLAGLALELAEWGACDLSFLTPPPDGPLSDARALLVDLGAVEGTRITDHGRALARLPLHPRLGHMLALAGRSAAPLAALLSDRDPIRAAGADLSIRLDALASRRRDPALDRIRAEASRLSRVAPATRISDPSAQAALAYPDRIALRRKGRSPRWLLSGGKGVKMDASDPLAASPLLVVVDTDGHPTEASIRTALPVSESTLRDVLGDRVMWTRSVRWSSSSGRVVAEEEERLGAIVLSSRRWKDAPRAEISCAMMDGIRRLGLSLSPTARQLQARVTVLRTAGHDLPDMADETLLDTLEGWLLPRLGDVRTASGWKALDVSPSLRAMLDWRQAQVLDREAPPTFETPLGRKVTIDYTAPDPEVRLRVQELFGTRLHPSVAGRPLCVTLLSPAGRPVQTTMDLPGFWASSYADVRKEMKGRYPKHHWPEDPAAAMPGPKSTRRE